MSPIRSSTRPPNKSFYFDFNAKPSDLYRSPARVDGHSDDSESEFPRKHEKGTATTKTSSKPPLFAPSKQPASQNTMASQSDSQMLASHLALLKTATGSQDNHELSGTPIFTMPVLEHSKHMFSQYGFIAGMSDILEHTKDSTAPTNDQTDPRLFFNISAPSSAFICGSQGSGKSHTLSCLLENCLMKSHVSKLDNPLSGLVFHYDSFSSDLKGSPCEAAHLSSNPNIKVRILCSPTNIQTIKRTYLGMNVQIEPLRINQTDLNTKRMMDLMAVTQDDGRMPLYLHSITRILREMRITQQQTNGSFNYTEFKRQVADTTMTREQLAPLTQRLDTLKSFMPKSQTMVGQPSRKSKDEGGNSWTVQPGSLTIVDLSCPCVTPEGACSLFNMCLSLFLEQKTTVGRVVALDEAHKYMNAASEATALTNTLLSSIRLQRHLGTRVFISTQEPTISPKLLDLCSFTIVHRFSSPDWLRCLKSHLAALDIEEDSTHTQKTKIINIFNQIVKLRVGEALLFAPSATTGVEASSEDQSALAQPKLVRLGLGFLKIRIRGRITTDGGKSVMATGTSAPPMNLGTSNKPSQVDPKAPAKAGPSVLASVPKVQAQPFPTSSAFGTLSHNPAPNPVISSTFPSVPNFGAAPQTSAPITAAPSIFATAPTLQPQAAPTFGAPSPTPRVFDGLRTSAPLTAVENLKDRGMLGFGHTPPVTRKASGLGPLVKLPPQPEKLVHGAANSNIFGSLQKDGKTIHPNVSAKAFADLNKAAPDPTKNIGNPNVPLKVGVLDKIPKENKPIVQPEVTVPPKSKGLTSSIFASPPKAASAKIATPPFPTTTHIPDKPSHTITRAPVLFCPGTRFSNLTPHSEIEPSEHGNMRVTFQHVGFIPAFYKFSPEELRLADYATAPIKKTPVLAALKTAFGGDDYATNPITIEKKPVMYQK